MRKKKKSFAVIGLGFFGMALALELADADCDVLAIDDKEENIQEVADKVTYAIKADVREPGVLKNLGVGNVDVAIVTVSENMEASILATAQVKDLGVPQVLAKAQNKLHGRILKKVGADEVLYPEQSMGKRVAHNLLTSGYLDIFELSTESSIAEFRIPKQWIGKTLAELHIREKYRVTVIGIRIGEKVEVSPDPHVALAKDSIIVAVGGNRELNSLPTE